jgi:hypothetical protein
MDREWLRAQGFVEEEGGYVLHGARLDEVGRLLGFIPAALRVDPGLAPDQLRGAVELNGGRCIIDFLEPAEEAPRGDALVDARVELDDTPRRAPGAGK